MPFYGSTPVEAARLLCDWLTRAHARARRRRPVPGQARCRIGRCHPFDAARASPAERAVSRLLQPTLTLLLVAWLTPIAAAAQDAVLPRVRLVATGGTISNRTGGRLTAEELVKSMPGVERYARPEFEQFTNVASSELTLDQWLALAKRLNELSPTDRTSPGSSSPAAPTRSKSSPTSCT